MAAMYRHSQTVHAILHSSEACHKTCHRSHRQTELACIHLLTQFVSHIFLKRFIARYEVNRTFFKSECSRHQVTGTGLLKNFKQRDLDTANIQLCISNHTRKGEQAYFVVYCLLVFLLHLQGSKTTLLLKSTKHKKKEAKTIFRRRKL